MCFLPTGGLSGEGRSATFWVSGWAMFWASKTSASAAMDPIAAMIDPLTASAVMSETLSMVANASSSFSIF